MLWPGQAWPREVQWGGRARVAWLGTAVCVESGGPLQDSRPGQILRQQGTETGMNLRCLPGIESTQVSSIRSGEPGRDSLVTAGHLYPREMVVAAPLRCGLWRRNEFGEVPEMGGWFVPAW